MKEIAASQYLALVGLLNTQLNSVSSALDADQSAQDLLFDALQLLRLILETPSHESDVRDGAEAQSGPGRDC